MRPALALFALSILLGVATVPDGFARSALQDPIEGIVREADGGPVASARIELRAAGRLLASSRTDLEGRFRISPSEARAPGWTLHVDRLGYRPAELELEPDATTVEILLFPAPLPVPGFEIVGEGDVCAGSREEDAVARELWIAASRRHARGLDTVGVASYTRVRTDTLAGGGTAGEGMEGATPGQRASAPLLRLSWNRRIERSGYAFAVRRTNSERSFDSWGYPPLEADFAPHFASDLFGERHEFFVEVEDGDGWVLRFCGRERDDPFLEGMLEVGPDTLVERAEWRFRTESPDEAAGGWARFPARTRGDASPPLLPTESVTWRTLPGGEVLRRTQWYDGWVIARGDSVPFLPQRDGDQSEPVIDE